MIISSSKLSYENAHTHLILTNQCQLAMETKIKTEPVSEAAVPETRSNSDFLKSEQDWSELDDFDYQKWDLNFNKNNKNLESAHDNTESRNTKKENGTKAQNYSERPPSIGELSNFPSFSEIQKSLEVVRKAFPETFTDQIIDKLFQYLMEKMINPSKKVPSPPVLPKQCVPAVTRQDLYNTKNRTNFQKLIPRQRSKSNPEIPPRKKFRFKEQQMNPALLKFGPLGRKQRQQLPNPQKGIAGRLDKVWTQQFQETLLNLYKKGNQFSFIRDHFQQQYPQHHLLFTVNSLRGRFYKVVRQTIRKLYDFIDKIGRQYFPRMVKLSYSVIQNIMYFQEGRDLRCLLIDLYFSEKLNKGLVDRIIQALLNFINETKHLQNNKQHPEK